MASALAALRPVHEARDAAVRRAWGAVGIAGAATAFLTFVGVVGLGREGPGWIGDAGFLLAMGTFGAGLLALLVAVVQETGRQRAWREHVVDGVCTALGQLRRTPRLLTSVEELRGAGVLDFVDVCEHQLCVEGGGARARLGVAHVHLYETEDGPPRGPEPHRHHRSFDGLVVRVADTGARRVIVVRRGFPPPVAVAAEALRVEAVDEGPFDAAYVTWARTPEALGHVLPPPLRDALVETAAALTPARITCSLMGEHAIVTLDGIPHLLEAPEARGAFDESVSVRRVATPLVVAVLLGDALVDAYPVA